MAATTMVRMMVSTSNSLKTSRSFQGRDVLLAGVGPFQRGPWRGRRGPPGQLYPRFAPRTFSATLAGLSADRATANPCAARDLRASIARAASGAEERETVS